jgi:homoserine O-acetyltransferase/O-succinyltransferase
MRRLFDRTRNALAAGLLLGMAAPRPSALAAQAAYPEPAQHDYVIRGFTFRDGGTLSELRMHYRTLGTLRKDARGRATNAVLIMHGTTGAGTNFLNAIFAGELFGPGELLDATKYFIVLPDAIGHGQSSRPSEGLHARFPHYGYRDMVDADHRLLTEGLGVNHLRLVMGTSMGGMHTWLWGEMYPDFMDALMPLASVPGPISGRNRMWRKMIIDAVQNDPDYEGGDYTGPLRAMAFVGDMLSFMGGNPITHYRAHPTLASVDSAMADTGERFMRTRDANDILYAFRASEDYDPAPDLEKIQAPLVAINSADDLINPPELRILEKEIVRVKRGRAVVIPLSDETVGHGTHTKAVVWKRYLAELLTMTEPRRP